VVLEDSMLYRVVTRVRHDGEVYEPGSTGEFEGSAAASLLAGGAIAPLAASVTIMDTSVGVFTAVEEPEPVVEPVAEPVVEPVVEPVPDVVTITTEDVGTISAADLGVVETAPSDDEA
jgi:hypothetical protein